MREGIKTDTKVCGEHWAFRVDGEHRACQPHDLPDLASHSHPLEPRPAQLEEHVPHVLQGNLLWSHTRDLCRGYETYMINYRSSQ